MKLSEGDVVLCTVKKIEGTSVFLEIENGGVGTMVLSEVSAGRIRNLRDFVFPGKKIVCKVLKIFKGDIELSLRRVKGGEREDVMEGYKKEKILRNVFKNVTPEYDKIVRSIKEKYGILDFLDEIEEKPEILEEFLGREDAKKVIKIIFEKERKEKEIDREVVLKSFSGEGVKDIRDVLNVEADVRYLGNSRFSVAIKSGDFKNGELKMKKVLEEIEKRAKEKKMFFEVKK